MNAIFFNDSRSISDEITRRNHSPAVKAKVDLETLKGEKTFAQLAAYYDPHANQIRSWKTHLLEIAGGSF